MTATSRGASTSATTSPRASCASRTKRSAHYSTSSGTARTWAQAPQSHAYRRWPVTNLYIDAPANLYLNRYGGTTGLVQVGDPGGSNLLTFNVSGNITQQGIKVCLANGTNCLSGNNTGNISSITQGNGITVTNPNGPSPTIATNAATCGGGQYSYWNGSTWQCGTPSGSGNVTGGGSSNYVPLWTSGSNIGNSIIWANTTNVGIGTTTPNFTLQVIGTANVSGALYANGSTVCTASNGFCLASIPANVLTNGTGAWNVTLSTTSVLVNGSQVCTAANGLCGGASSSGGWTNNTQNTTTTLKFGIGTTAPNYTLHVVGTANITGAVYLTNSACSAGQYLTTSGGAVSCGTPAGSTPTLGQVLNAGNVATQAIDMNNTNLILNIGNAGTDFTSGGGLNLAGTLAVAGAGPHTIAGTLNVASNGLFANSTNVGIGTTSPNASLDILSSAPFALSIENASTQFLSMNGTTGDIILGSSSQWDRNRPYGLCSRPCTKLLTTPRTTSARIRQ